MENETENINCHVCLESEVTESSDFECQTENCHFQICNDCKRKYFVEQQQTICPGCRQQSIDLSALDNYQTSSEFPSLSNDNLELIKTGRILFTVIISTVLAYFLGSSIFVVHHEASTNIVIIVVQIIFGYLIIGLIVGSLYICCSNT